MADESKSKQKKQKPKAALPKIESVDPIQLLIHTPQAVDKASSLELVVIAVKEYQGKRVVRAGSDRRYFLETEEDIGRAIDELTAGKRHLSQSCISKKIKKIQQKLLEVNSRLYTIEKMDGHYVLVEYDECYRHIKKYLTEKNVFFDNPHGTPSTFAVVVEKKDVPIVKQWFENLVGNDLFKLFVKGDTIFVMLRTGSKTFKTTSKKLKELLQAENIANANYSLRNFAASWKK